ncbi:MAG: chloride channel protein [Chloroflexota bacterium]
MSTGPSAAIRRSAATRLRRWTRDAGYIRKWVVLGLVIGVVAGLGALAFVLLLDLARVLFLGLLGGWTPPSPAGEGGDPITDFARAWAIPLVVALGGLLSGIIVFRLAPEAEGHGTDAAIAAFHHRPRGIRARVPIVKMVASAITIGSGGSAGREGPTAQISAGFASFLARVLDLEQRDARIAVAAGMAAGIGAIFRAPLGGAVLGAELLYRDDIESDALLPSFIATIVAFSVFGAVAGFQPIFGELAGTTFGDPTQLVWYVVLGVLAGLVGRLYIASFYGLTARFTRWTTPPRWLKPAIAGLAVGCIGLVIPGALGTGYGFVAAALTHDGLLGLPLWMVLALPFAKILATSLTIGSGGSGGVFGPGMVIGGLLGASMWRLLEGIAPGIPPEPAPFVIVGMMVLFGSIAHAPLAVMLMVAEMTGNLSMLAPAMIAIGVASFVVGERSIYRSQLVSRADSPAHRYRFAMPLLSMLSVRDAARAPRLVLSASMAPAEAQARLAATGLPGAPVVDADGLLVGSVLPADLAGDQADPSATIGELAAARLDSVVADDPLDEAMGLLADAHLAWVPVVQDRRVVGVLSSGDAMRAYRAASERNVRRVRGLEGDTVLLDARVPAGSPLAGRTVAGLGLPAGAVVLAIERSERTIVPGGSVELRAGDRIAVVAEPSVADEVRAMLDQAGGAGAGGPSAAPLPA